MRAYLALACLVVCVQPAAGVDLNKIERVIAKEPRYQEKPKYCLLVFGPEAKFRAWLVLDGTVLYVDRNGNGDLTGPDNRVLPHQQQKDHYVWFKPGVITSPDGKTKYKVTQVFKESDNYYVSISSANQVLMRAGQDGPGPLRFADRAADAPILHVGGALTLKRFDPQADSASCDLKPGPLMRGRPNQLGFSLGTPGMGSGSFAKLYLCENIKASVEVRLADRKTIISTLEPDN